MDPRDTRHLSVGTGRTHELRYAGKLIWILTVLLRRGGPVRAGRGAQTRWNAGATKRDAGVSKREWEGVREGGLVGASETWTGGRV